LILYLFFYFNVPCFSEQGAAEILSRNGKDIQRKVEPVFARVGVPSRERIIVQIISVLNEIHRGI